MELHSITVSVKNIDLAIDFYTQKLYFKKKKDISKIHKKTKIQHRKVSLVSIKPQLIGLSKIAVFSDGCGNHIQINEDV